MSFLQPALLLALPLALLPVLIHLINQHRHRTVKWAAMMFLLDARKLTRGIARLRQLLILAMRVLAVAALVFAASRPLSGGWIGLAGGRVDTVLVLLDRSASMEQRHPETQVSKRTAALDRLAGLLERTASASEILLIDSATLEITRLDSPSDLAALPETAPTATAADIPALLSRALEHLETDASGRVDLWLASDLRHASWDPASDRWSTIRSALADRETARLALLAFAEEPEANLSIRVSGTRRRPDPEGIPHLVMDLAIQRQGYRDGMPPVTVPVEFTLDGTRTVEEMTVDGPELVRLGHTLPLADGSEQGWGRIDLPADENPADNAAFFVYDEAPTRLTVVLGDHRPTAEAIRTAATAAPDAALRYEALVLGTHEAARIPWEEASLLFWQAALPEPGSNEAALLAQFVESGRSLVLLPPVGAAGDDAREFLGLRWEAWREREDAPLEIGWWRSESGLLAHTRSGAPLPVDELRLHRVRPFSGEAQPLLRLADGAPVLGRATLAGQGSLYLWGTLPDAAHSTLATDGIVFFVMLHRALEDGAAAVSGAQSRETGPAALARSGRRSATEPGGSEPRLLDALTLDDLPATPGLVPGAFAIDEGEGNSSLVALNRPASEDDARVLAEEALGTLLEGVDYRLVSDTVAGGGSLAAEIWRIFLVAMALALLAEAILSLPAANVTSAASGRDRKLQTVNREP